MRFPFSSFCLSSFRRESVAKFRDSSNDSKISRRVQEPVKYQVPIFFFYTREQCHTCQWTLSNRSARVLSTFFFRFFFSFSLSLSLLRSIEIIWKLPAFYKVRMLSKSNVAQKPLINAKSINLAGHFREFLMRIRSTTRWTIKSRLSRLPDWNLLIELLFRWLEYRWEKPKFE